MCDSNITDRDLMGQIASKLYDYRNPPANGMDVEHVSRWIEQFEPGDRRFVLEETDRFMEIGYFSEQDYQRMASELADDEENERFFQNAAFLDIQIQGSSQHEFMTLLHSEREEEINLVSRISTREWVNSFQEFIYIDDVSFSGAKAINDLGWFINNFNLRNITIYVYFFGYHTFAEWKIKDLLEREFSDRNIAIGVGGGDFRYIENQRRNSASSGVLWPTPQSVVIPAWATNLASYAGTYRNGYVVNDIFPHELRRDRFEAILTKVGFDILGNSQNPSPVIKPLGFSTFNGVGFGGTIFTFRNCPNNTPLAFWWGNYQPSGNRALDCWYPLMKRIVYNQ